MIRGFAFGTLAVAAAVVVIIVATSGDDPYVLKVNLTNASGLKSGSPIIMSGVTRGKVKLHLLRDDRIQAELQIDRDVAPLGRNATVAVTAANFLGQKRVELTKGNVAQPAPSGYMVPASQVTTPTDLDQVLDVLDADTRTRATILLNELGVAVVGRKFDISQLLKQFPQGFVDANAVLRQLQSDDHSLKNLVSHSDSFVAEATARRKALTRMVGVLGSTAKTVAAKRVALRATLARAPATLRTLQRFLGDLESTTKPLKPAAQAIADSAPALSATLAQVDPFTRAARPALAEARVVAPKLTQLGDQATPILKKAIPAATTLASLSGDLNPISNTLDHSADNIIAILENWSRAIQFRDGLGHVFRGEAGYSTDLLTSMMDRLIRPADRKKAKKDTATPQKKDTPVKKIDIPAPAKKLLDDLPKTVQKIVGNVIGGTEKQLKDTLDGLLKGGKKSDQDSTKSLLDYLLGK